MTIPWQTIIPLVFCQCPSKAKIFFKAHNSLSMDRTFGPESHSDMLRRAQDHLLPNRSVKLGGTMYYSASAHAFFFFQARGGPISDCDTLYHCCTITNTYDTWFPSSGSLSTNSSRRNRLSNMQQGILVTCGWLACGRKGSHSI